MLEEVLLNVKREDIYDGTERKYYPINSEFYTKQGNKLRVLPGTCDDCFYHDLCDKAHQRLRMIIHPECIYKNRSDCLHVFFQEIK